MVRIIKISEIPKKRHIRVPRAFRLLEEWPAAMKAMDEDRIGVGEAAVLPVTTMEGFKNLKAVARPFKKFIKDRYKGKYTVLARVTREGPQILICRPHGSVKTLGAG